MTEGDVNEIEVSPSENVGGRMSLEEALQQVLKRSLVCDGLSRGIRECAKALDRGQAQLCVLAESCNEDSYVKLIEALCAERGVTLAKVNDAKTLGEWVGLCKIDREGNPRKVVGCGVVVVKDYGEQSEALNVLNNLLSARE
jgi:small subunit ribosomal protein S12e